MSKNPNSIPNHNNESSNKDIQSIKLAADSLKTFREKRTENAIQNATYHFENIYDLQNDFAKRSELLKESGAKMTNKQFEAWEDDFLSSLDYAQKIIEEDDLNLSEIAEAKQHMITSTDDSELHKTIEAQAGNFYQERTDALRTAILSSRREDTEADLDYLASFPSIVAKHLDFKYMSRKDVNDYGPDDYERNRTTAHNNAIKHLNGLNDLAKKYHTRPFTVRNFWPSDIRSKRTQTPAIAKVMRYDRDIVEEYYAIAFSSEVRKRKAKQERFKSYGIY